MYGQLAFDFVISFIQTAFGQERCRCPFEFIDASAFCISGATVIGILTHVEQHELEVRRFTSLTPLLLWSWDTELLVSGVRIGCRPL